MGEVNCVFMFYLVILVNVDEVIFGVDINVELLIEGSEVIGYLVEVGWLELFGVIGVVSLYLIVLIFGMEVGIVLGFFMDVLWVSWLIYYFMLSLFLVVVDVVGFLGF